MGGDREVFIDLEPGTRIRFRRSEAPPPVSYAITLEILEDSEWTTVRLWDNADDVDEHHEHAYTRRRGQAAADDLGVQVEQRCNGGGDPQSQG